jgi:SAM-dependent methyltransferase
MAGLIIPRAHSNDWYDHLATIQEGYYYPWESTIANRNGDQAFNELISESINPEDVVLEIGCGHGELALAIATRCQKVIAYDRVPAYIELAEQRRKAAGADNVTFLCYDLLDPALDEPHLPVEDQSIDVIVCRLGPSHWIQDAVRACNPGARLIQLSPMEEPIPAWTDVLPKVMHYQNSGRHSGTGSIHHSIENRLHQAGLMLHSGWGFDVPEVFHDKEQLYRMVTWGLPTEKTPTLEDVSFKLDTIFEKYSEPTGIVLRHCRYLWFAMIP